MKKIKNYMVLEINKYKVQNIVATTSLGKVVPLVKLARTNPNTEYNPDTFPGLILRIKKPIQRRSFNVSFRMVH